MAPESKGKNMVFYGTALCFTIFLIFGLNCVRSVATSNSTNDTIEIQSRHLLSAISENKTTNNTSAEEEVVGIPSEVLKQLLINHTLEHGGEQDLDKLIFSAIPEGSKLVLQSVQVIETSEDGDPVNSPQDKFPIHWNIRITNATEEFPEENSDSSAEEYADSGEETDMAFSGSHSSERYKAYGDHANKKVKSHKNYHGQDFGKHHKVTYTDTDGKKDKKYHGKEDGLLDYKHHHGKANSGEGERYRNTKKKNKGRRVQGFKRVYHKEEFQRTEHFYDDEAAKRVAESYGMKDSKETKQHGLKDDDKKYHGLRKEYTDGKKIKDEKGTSHAYNKGQKTKYKDSERHHHLSQFANAHSSHHPNSFNQHQPFRHPSHNYHGSFSHVKSTVSHPHISSSIASYLSTPQLSTHKPATPITPSAGIAEAPLTASVMVADHDTGPRQAASTEIPISLPSRSALSKKKGARRVIMEWPVAMEEQRSLHQRYFSPPAHLRHRFHPNQAFSKRTKAKSSKDSQMSSASMPLDTRNASTSASESYAGSPHPPNTITAQDVRNEIFPPSKQGYSTLVRLMPVNYIDLDNSSSSEMLDNPAFERLRNATVSLEPGKSTGSSSSKTGRYKHVFLTTNAPFVHANLRPHRAKWVSITLGNPPEGPNNMFPNNYESRPFRLPSLLESVKQRFRRPLAPQLFLPPKLGPMRHTIRYDTSRYPPNVVATNNGNIFTKSPSATRSNLTLSPLSIGTPQKALVHTSSNSVTKIKQLHNNGHPSSTSNNSGGRGIQINSLPPFMNSLMDSVANFFSSVG